MARLSDLSGAPTGPEVFSPYFTAYPLPTGSHFALAQTWPDLHAARSGCVLTHTLLIPLSDWRIVKEPRQLTSLYSLPIGRNDDAAYEKPLEWPLRPVALDLRPVPIEASARFVQLYFAKGKRPIVWLGHPDPEDALWRILRALWPALRGRFPAWARQLAVDDPRLFINLLNAHLKTDQRVDLLVTQLLNECDNLRLAHIPSILNDVANHKEQRFYSQLIDCVYTDLIRGFLDGTISENACLPVIQSDEMSGWIVSINHGTIISLLTYRVWNRRDNWLNGWKLLLLLPSTVYNREPSAIFHTIDGLIRGYYPTWSPIVVHTWTDILKRVRKDCSSVGVLLQLQVQAFKHAIYNSRLPLSEVVVETFPDIYKAVTSSSVAPVETSALFGMFDWDKGKELRKMLIDAFISSQWPPGDLALATSEPSLFPKIFKRVYRRSVGPRYLQAAFADLQTRTSTQAKQMAVIIGSSWTPRTTW